MFTGLVETIGTIADVRGNDELLRVRIVHDLGGGPVEPGESIAVNGCCLTAVDPVSGSFEADLSAETIQRTGGPDRWVDGHRVNLERAMRVGDRFGGHIVQGHVDGVAEVLDLLQHDDGSATLRIAVPDRGHTQLVDKGSVALDGVSLTIASLDERAFEIALIPTTLAETNLEDRRRGDRVNVEYDILSKYVQKAVAAHLSRER